MLLVRKAAPRFGVGLPPEVLSVPTPRLTLILPKVLPREGKPGRRVKLRDSLGRSGGSVRGPYQSCRSSSGWGGVPLRYYRLLADYTDSGAEDRLDLRNEHIPSKMPVTLCVRCRGYVPP